MNDPFLRYGGAGPAEPPWRKERLGSPMARLIGAHLAAVLAGVLLVFGAVFLSTSHELQAGLRRAVDAEIRELLKDYQDLGPFGLSLRIRQKIPSDRGGEAIYQLISPTGVHLVGNIKRRPQGVATDGPFVSTTVSLTDGRNDAPAEIRALRLSGGELLLVGRVSRSVRLFNDALWRATLISALVIAALSAAVVFSIMRLLRRRLATVSRTAEEIMRGDLSRRMTLSGSGDEFDQLSARLNAMLDRISDLVADLRMVTDSVAHDLRSPLTRLRGHLEDALSAEALRGEGGASARSSIGKALGETEATLAAFASLIAIARAEAGVGREQFERVAVSDLVFELAELYAPAAEEAGARLSATAEQGLVARGHRQLLAQAITNLVENALKHAPPGSEIRLSASASGGKIAVSVEDEGPGIPAQDRDRALRRFERLDPGRSGAGFGLGLALAAAVARLHGGELLLEDAARGRASPGLRASLAWAEGDAADPRAAPS